mgnify:FL=1|tara:strand:- start:3077 stop:3307 length:231 start_codon:yes stop_codon:yes gene_type:complete
MPQRELVPPILSTAPEVYSAAYVSDLARALTLLIDQVNTEGQLRASTAVLTALPTSATGLEVGTVYRDGTTLKVVT